MNGVAKREKERGKNKVRRKGGNKGKGKKCLREEREKKVRGKNTRQNE